MRSTRTTPTASLKSSEGEHGAASEGPYRLTIRASMERRRAEALALELRRRVKALGFDDVSVTIAPEPIRDDDGGGGADPGR